MHGSGIVGLAFDTFCFGVVSVIPGFDLSQEMHNFGTCAKPAVGTQVEEVSGSEHLASIQPEMRPFHPRPTADGNQISLGDQATDAQDFSSVCYVCGKGSSTVWNTQKPEATHVHRLGSVTATPPASPGTDFPPDACRTRSSGSCGQL